MIFIVVVFNFKLILGLSGSLPATGRADTATEEINVNVPATEEEVNAAMVNTG